MERLMKSKDILVEIMTQLEIHDLFNVALTNKLMWMSCQTKKFWNRHITKLYGWSYWESYPIRNFKDYEFAFRPIVFGKWEKSHRYIKTEEARRWFKVEDHQSTQSIYEEDYQKIPFGFKPIMISKHRQIPRYWRQLIGNKMNLIDIFNNTLPPDAVLDVSNMDLLTGYGCKITENGRVLRTNKLAVISLNVRTYVKFIRRLEMVSGENLQLFIDTFIEIRPQQLQNFLTLCQELEDYWTSN